LLLHVDDSAAIKNHEGNAPLVTIAVNISPKIENRTGPL
jgi:hypothetical protein